MYRVINPDLAHVCLEQLEFIVERDPRLPGVWGILAVQPDAPGVGTVLGAFLAVRQARHSGFTVWSTADGGRLLGYSTSPVSACDAVLRSGIG